MASLAEVKNVIERIERLRPNWNAKMIYGNRGYGIQKGIEIWFTSNDGTKGKITKTYMWGHYFSKWRGDVEIYFWQVELNVSSEIPLYNKTFCDSGQAFKTTNISRATNLELNNTICKYLESYIDTIANPILAVEEERQARAVAEYQAKRKLEESQEQQRVQSLKDKFWKS